MVRSFIFDIKNIKHQLICVTELKRAKKNLIIAEIFLFRVWLLCQASSVI